MLALIRSAQAPGSLKVQMEKIDRQVDDPDILCALIDRIQSGVQVQVLLNPDEPRNLRVARAITAAGGTAKYQNQTPPRPRLHAKMIIVNDQRVYLGSHNLTRKSLNERREIGWVTDDPGTISSFGTIFDQDWIEGTEELTAQPSCLP
jgi:phosphatidylserine/phosphatidylglycerophosphate/cardiolipin synthase-like enzyme